MDDTLFALTLVAAVGCGLLAGVVYAFSSAIMKALGRLPAAQGIAAMQSINITVINPWFMGAFFGPAPICVAVIVLSVLEWEEPEAFYRLAGSALYLVGAVLVRWHSMCRAMTHWRPSTRKVPTARITGAATL